MTSIVKRLLHGIAVLGCLSGSPALEADSSGRVASAAETDAGAFVWFGTYTGGPANGEGIYVSRFDSATGTLTAPVLAVAVKNPSFLAAHPTLPVMYAVSEVADADGKTMGAVLAFAIDEATGMLSPKSLQYSGGGGPCHVSVDRTGRVALAANYGSGSVVCFGLDADGGLRPVVAGSPRGFIQHEGTGPNAQRQKGPHGHSIYPTADGRFAIACDLGADRVFVHALDADKATLSPHGFGRGAPGAGPRHFAWHPDGRHGYAVNELDLTVTAFDFDPQSGTLATVQTIATLPADVGDTRGFSTAEIVAHPSGRFLYASNRGHDSIAMYAIDPATAHLTFLGTEPIRGKTPRNFVLDPTGKFLLAAGQNSNTVTVFAIDEKTGRLSFSGHSLDVTSPVCIRFRPIR